MGYRLWTIDPWDDIIPTGFEPWTATRLVETGPYRYTRHAAYAGMIVAHAGVCAFFFNGVTAGVFALILLPAILLRIVIEE